MKVAFFFMSTKVTFQLLNRGHVNGLFEVTISHLSKRPSDLKQNGTQEKTPFSSTVFNTLSHGVIHFLVSVSSKKTAIEILRQQIRSLYSTVFEANTLNKTRKGHGKLSQKMVSNVV